MKKLLITGSSGFIGLGIINKLSLDNDYQIYAVISGRRKIKFPDNVFIVIADLLNSDDVDRVLKEIKPDICIHLAWEQSTSDYRECNKNIEWVSASLFLFYRFQLYGGKHFVFAGTSGEYEYKANAISEVSTKQEMSLYGQSKKTVSDFLLKIGNKLGVKVQIARYFTIYGPGDTHKFGAIPETIINLINGNNVVCNFPESIRDYIYIDDAIEATIKLISTDYFGAVNIASGMPIKMRDVFYEIGKQLNCLDLISYNENAEVGKILFGDISILRNRINFNSKVNFSKGIANEIDYWKKIIED